MRPLAPSLLIITALAPVARAAPCAPEGTLALAAGCYHLPDGAELRLAGPAILTCAPDAEVDVAPRACPTTIAHDPVADLGARVAHLEGAVARLTQRLGPQPLDPGAALPTGPFYLPIADLHPGQVRISQANVQDKVDRALAAGDATALGGDRYTRHRDDGRAVLKLDAAVPVIAGPVGYVLVDGHHDVVASLRLGATTVAVTIKADLRTLSVAQFWAEAEARGYIYPRAIGGAHQLPPASFDALVDDPGRYFAAITARKCDRDDQPAALTTGAEYPLWVKVGKDVPFIEFMISDALAAPGDRPDDPPLSYPADAAPSGDQLAAARRRLAAHPIPGLRVVAVPTRFDALPELCRLAPQLAR